MSSGRKLEQKRSVRPEADLGTSRLAQRFSATTIVALLPGVVVCLLVAVLATVVGLGLPLVSSAVLALVLGMLLRAVWGPGATYKPGIKFSSKYVLQGSVVLLGCGLSVGQLWHTGARTLPVMVGSLVVALAAAALLGRALGVGWELRTLIGSGTAICGGSAIAATGAAISASEVAMAYSISTIFVYNALAVVIFPLLGHLMAMTPTTFGVWAGTAINDTSSVVAAGYTFGAAAGATAVIVKLARTTMIIPITLGLSVWHVHHSRRGGRAGAPLAWHKIVPWFVLWFCAAVVLNSVGMLPGMLVSSSARTAQFLITVALAGVGLSANFREMRRTGFRPLVLGGLLWVVVAVTSLLLQSATGLL